MGALSWSGAGLGSAARTPRRKVECLEAGVPLTPAERRRSGGTPHAQEVRAVHEGVRPLEIDWSQVVRRCIDGDSGAWVELVHTHHRRVYALCYRFTGNPADAEDLTQDVFLKIYSNLASFDTGRGSLQVWITTMTRNLLVDNFRRTRNQRATGSLDDGWDAADELRPIDRLVSSHPSPHETAAQKELAQMVQEALARVSPELREAVILRDLQDMDYKEVAQVLGIPEGTVKSRISRGRAELARLLERSKREVM
ncbi:MAG TPA: sigma-70 family RNA polymerase sigma factor [Terracidiphilus sp.]|nr:sigma-70 family RNA polymerase sigma factor [Terracidiphilus sp.]